MRRDVNERSLTLVENDEDSSPWLVGLGELGVADVEDGGDVVEVVVELLATPDLEAGGGLGDVARHIGRHCGRWWGYLVCWWGKG